MQPGGMRNHSSAPYKPWHPFTTGPRSESRIPTLTRTLHRSPQVQYLRNSCALLSEKGVPLGSRIRAVLPHEFAKPRWKKLSLLGKRLF